MTVPHVPFVWHQYPDTTTQVNAGPLNAVESDLAAVGQRVITDPTNTIAASGTAVTIPAPTSAVLNDVTLTAANVSFTLPNVVAGQSIVIVLRQDATGSRIPSFPGVRWPRATIPQWSIAAGAVDLVNFYGISGAWLGFASIGMA